MSNWPEPNNHVKFICYRVLIKSSILWLLNIISFLIPQRFFLYIYIYIYINLSFVRSFILRSLIKLVHAIIWCWWPLVGAIIIPKLWFSHPISRDHLMKKPKKASYLYFPVLLVPSWKVKRIPSKLINSYY